MSDAWVVWLALGSLVLLALGVLAWAWTRDRLGLAAVVVFFVALAAWVADFVAISADFHDADGFVDCRDDCRPAHRLAALGFVAPPLLVALAAGGMLLALLARGRRRRMGENRP